MTWHETIGYRDLRPPYLPGLFVEAARRLRLTGREDLLDLGCGFGALMFAFAPHVGTLTGIDAELDSLQVLEARARELGRAVRVVHAPVEIADETLGPFDLITIGKAHWYMRSPATLARIGRWLRPGGRVLVCAPTEERIDAEGWERAYFLTLTRWSNAPPLPSRLVSAEDFFAGTDFVAESRIDVHGERAIDLDHLVNRAFGYPHTTRAALGERAEPMAQALRKIMARFFRNGPIVEKLHTWGVILKRQDDA